MDARALRARPQIVGVPGEAHTARVYPCGNTVLSTDFSRSRWIWRTSSRMAFRASGSAMVSFTCFTCAAYSSLSRFTCFVTSSSWGCGDWSLEAMQSCLRRLRLRLPFGPTLHPSADPHQDRGAQESTAEAERADTGHDEPEVDGRLHIRLRKHDPQDDEVDCHQDGERRTKDVVEPLRGHGSGDILLLR